jgi:hypothetical protein
VDFSWLGGASPRAAASSAPLAAGAEARTALTDLTAPIEAAIEGSAGAGTRSWASWRR